MEKDTSIWRPSPPGLPGQSRPPVSARIGSLGSLQLGRSPAVHTRELVRRCPSEPPLREGEAAAALDCQAPHPAALVREAALDREGFDDAPPAPDRDRLALRDGVRVGQAQLSWQGKGRVSRGGRWVLAAPRHDTRALSGLVPMFTNIPHRILLP